MWGLAAHDSVVVCANVEPANIITHDHENVRRFGGCGCLGRMRRIYSGSSDWHQEARDDKYYDERQFVVLRTVIQVSLLSASPLLMALCTRELVSDPVTITGLTGNQVIAIWKSRWFLC